MSYFSRETYEAAKTPDDLVEYFEDLEWVDEKNFSLSSSNETLNTTQADRAESDAAAWTTTSAPTGKGIKFHRYAQNSGTPPIIICVLFFKYFKEN